MYVYLSSEGLVGKNEACTYRTILSEKLDFGDSEYEVALVSWQYYGQKFATHLRYEHERMIELQKCIARTDTLIWQWNMNVEELWIEINDSRESFQAGDYTWQGFLDNFISHFRALTIRLRIPTNIQQTRSGFQLLNVPSGTKLKFGRKICDLLGIDRNYCALGLTFPSQINMNMEYMTITSPLSKPDMFSIDIKDIIEFHRGAHITTDKNESDKFDLVRGIWSLADFEKLVQTKFEPTFIIVCQEVFVSTSATEFQSGNNEDRPPNFWTLGYISHNNKMSGKKLFFSRRLIHDLGITWATRYQPNLNSQFPISNWWDWPSINILLHDRIYFHMPWLVDREEPVKKIYINQSTFSSTQSLLATLTKTVSSSAGTDGKNIFKFYLNDAQKVCIEHATTKDGVRWLMRPSSQILKKLGFDIWNKEKRSMQWLGFGSQNLEKCNKKLVLTSFDMLANNEPNGDVLYTDSLPNFWIFCDVIQDQHVGSRQLPLLRNVANNAPEDNFWIEPCDPYYLPVNKKQVNAITVTVCGRASLDAVIHLENPVLVILHFRQRS